MLQSEGNKSDPDFGPEVQAWIQEQQRTKDVVGREIVHALKNVAPEKDYYPNWPSLSDPPDDKRLKIPEVFLKEADVSNETARRVHRNAVIEVIGFPESGKSSLCSKLATTLGQRLGYNPELQSKMWRPSSHPGISLSAVADEITARGVADEDIGEMSREQFYTRLKLMSALEVQDAAFTPPAAGQVFTHRLIERGLNDFLAVERAFWYMLGKEELVSALQLVNARVDEIDAVILMGVNYKTAIERRLNAGRFETSAMVNPIRWPRINEGYSWWLLNVYPILRRTYGMGILVLKGEDNIDINTERARIFVSQVCDKCEGIA